MPCNLCQKLNIYEKSDKLKGISFWQLWEATGRVTTYELVLLSRRVLCSHCIGWIHGLIQACVFFGVFCWFSG